MEVAKIKINGTNAEVSELKTITTGMVGATVIIEYDETWDSLNKQVVFRTHFRTVNAEGTTIPHELLTFSGTALQVGVYGYTGDGTVAIPTLWASLGNIKPGADPEGDEAAKPTLPIWARMQAQIDGVEESFNELKTSANTALDAATSAAESAEQKADVVSKVATEASSKADFVAKRLDRLETSVNTGLSELDTMIGGE